MYGCLNIYTKIECFLNVGNDFQRWGIATRHLDRFKHAKSILDIMQCQHKRFWGVVYVCMYTCMQVCSYVDIWRMFVYCSSHHFLHSPLQPDWPVSSGIQLPLHLPPIQHCSYRCMLHAWLLHRCWSSDLKSSYLPTMHLLTKPSHQPSSPSLNSFGVSGYRHILSLSPHDLFFHSGIVQMKNWYIFKQSQRSVAGSHDLLEAWKAWGNLPANGHIQTTRNPLTHNEQRQKSWNSSPTRSHAWGLSGGKKFKLTLEQLWAKTQAEEGVGAPVRGESS